MALRDGVVETWPVRAWHCRAWSGMVGPGMARQGEGTEFRFFYRRLL